MTFKLYEPRAFDDDLAASMEQVQAAFGDVPGFDVAALVATGQPKGGVARATAPRVMSVIPIAEARQISLDAVDILENGGVGDDICVVLRAIIESGCHAGDLVAELLAAVDAAGPRDLKIAYGPRLAEILGRMRTL